MKNLARFAFLILLPSLVCAQQGDPYLEGLHKSLVEASNDTTRMEACGNLGDYYLLANQDSSRFYFEKALPLAAGLKLKLNEASILNSLGLLLMYHEQYAQSFQTFLRAIKIAQDPKSEERTWHLQPGQDAARARLSVLGYTYDFIGLLNAFAGNWTENIGNQLKNYREAERLGIAAQNGDLIALSKLHMGIASMNAGKLDSAVHFERQAVSMFSGQKNDWYVGASMKYLGDTYEKKGNLDSALFLELQAIRLLEQTSDYGHRGRAYLSLSRIYMDTKRPDSSLYFGRKALYVFENLKDPEGKREAYNLLASHFDQLHYPDSATIYLKLAKSVSDSLSQEQRKNLLAFQDVVVDEQLRLEKLEKEKVEARDKQKIFLLISGITVFIIVAFLLYRNSRHRKKANEVLQQRNKKIENTLNQLKSTQQQLVQSEKMASLGELTAGIAHEIQNPLNFVNNFSEVNKELVEELRLKNEKLKIEDDEVRALLNDITQNLDKINYHGKRADAIVKGMLQHSRTSSGHKELTDINALCDEYLRLAYHGLRAKDKSFNADIKTDFGGNIGKINIVPQDIGRVILNLINNACYAVSERDKLHIAGYKPQVLLSTKRAGDKILISVADNGDGISQNIVDKIFQPFFTTKPTGQGTGLGLSLAYDIVKAHGGDIKVNTRVDEGLAAGASAKAGSEFTIHLPVA